MHSFITLTLATLSALTAAVPHARKEFSFNPIRDVAALVEKNAPLAGRAVPGTFNLSPVGECGGSSGFQCGPGFCCSKWGYCGQGDSYCGAGGSGVNTTASSGPSKAHHRRPHHKKPHHGHGKPHHRPPPAYTPPPTQSPTAAPAPSSPAPAPTYSSPAAPAPTTGGGNWAYKMFNGDGSASAGWPSQDSWVDFETAFQASTVNMKASCAQWNEQNDSDQEIADIKSAIQSVASSSGLDERFILAIMMQESNGCVRVQTTDNGVTNPGLMQSHDGPGTCWHSGTGTVPCPASEITQMIKDGSEGTPSGDGLKQTKAQCSSSGSQSYYQAAVIYNSGNLPSNLGDNTATPCYASDVANRLMGWFSGTSSCTL